MDYLNWTLSSRKLFKLQRKIQETEKKNPRLCRNFQRLFYRKSELQLFIIHKILQIQLKRPTDKKGDMGCEGFLGEPVRSEPGIIQEKIIFSKLVSKEYRYFLTGQIMNILWVFALSPILENKKNDLIILTGLESSQIYKIIGLFLQKPLIKYILISQFSNYFNKKNKIWILSNLLIEKKFFFHWLKSEKLYRLSKTVKPWQFKYVGYEKTKILSLKTTLENFTNFHFMNTYIPQILKFKEQIQESLTKYSLQNDKKMGIRKFRNKALILNGQKSFIKVYPPEKSLINFQKSLFIKLNPKIMRSVDRNVILPIFYNFFSTDKTIQFKKYPTKLQKNNIRFYNLASRMFQFTKIMESMPYSSKVIPIKTYPKQLHPLGKMKFYEPNSQITDFRSRVPLRFSKKYLYRKFFQSIITFKFTHYCYFIKFCLKKQSYFQIYMNKGSLRSPLRRGSSPAFGWRGPSEGDKRSLAGPHGLGLLGPSASPARHYSPLASNGAHSSPLWGAFGTPVQAAVVGDVRSSSKPP